MVVEDQQSGSFDDDWIVAVLVAGAGAGDGAGAAVLGTVDVTDDSVHRWERARMV